MSPYRAVLATSLALLSSTVPAAAALAHGGTDTVRGHLEEDAVVHDGAQEARLAGRTSRATAADAVTAAQAVAAGNEGDVGQWGPVTDWPVVGIHNALLPDGRVLAYDSINDKATET